MWILLLESDSLVGDGAKTSEFSKRPSGLYNVGPRQRNTIWINHQKKDGEKHIKNGRNHMLTSDVLVLMQAPIWQSQESPDSITFQSPLMTL